MSIGEICNTRVSTALAGTTVLAAAQAMHSFGDRLLVVTEEREGRPVAVGVVTEHDLVGVMAQGEDPSRLTLRDVMCAHPAFVAETDDVLDTLCWMRRHHLYDVIVHGKAGAILGTVSLDQIADSIAGDLSDVASCAAEERGLQAAQALH